MLDSVPFAVVLAAIPGVFAWWSGARILRFMDDPALGERVLTRAGQVNQVAIVAMVVLLLLQSPISNWLIPVVFFGVALGGFQARRRLLEERWSFGQYLVFTVRLGIALLGFWMLVIASPHIVLSAGKADRIVALLLAGLLVTWYARQYAIFPRVLGAVQMELPDHLRMILAQSRVRGSRFWRIPVVGGRLATAWALPSSRHPGVAFTDPVFESLTDAEQGAVYAHELAHIEQIGEASVYKRLQAWGIIGAFVATGTLGPLVPGVEPWMVVLWVMGVLLFFSRAMSQRRKFEIASDRRAVELCGDAAALERALVKLTILARLPRRWGLDFEAASTHPSLARRIQAIRAMGATTGSSDISTPVETVVTSVLSRAGTPVVFGPDHIEWSEGGKTRRFAYGELADLRIQAGLIGRPSMQVTELSGRLWKISLDSRVVPEIQAALDRVDTRLGKLTASPRVLPWLTRGLASGLLVLVWLMPSVSRSVAFSVSSVAAGAAGLLSPGLTALVALTVASGGLAIVSIMTGIQGAAVLVTGMLALDAIGAAVLAVRYRRVWQSRRSRLMPTLLLTFALVEFWGVFIYSAFSNEEHLLLIPKLVRSIPDLWLLPITLASAIVVSTEGRLRWLAGAPILLIALVVILVVFT